ncbi:MAG: hypothetical protein ACIAS6_09575 [Phycisphaerales bacterium JB060]
MARTRIARPLLIAASMAGFLLVPGAMAQDGPPDPPLQERGEGDPGRLSALVERRLDQAERQQERLREIKRRLDAGESPMAIMAELRERGELGLLGEWGRSADRDGPRRSRDGDGPRDPEQANGEGYAEWRTRVMAFLEEHAPDMAMRLREEGDSDEARRAVFHLRREVDRLIELREKGSDEFEPALARLRNGMRIAVVVGKVREAAQADAPNPRTLRELRRELTELVGTQFDAQLAARAKWLERMGERLQGARERLERERAERSQRIEAEVNRMFERAMNPGEERDKGGDRRRDPKRGPR